MISHNNSNAFVVKKEVRTTRAFLEEHALETKASRQNKNLTSTIPIRCQARLQHKCQ